MNQTVEIAFPRDTIEAVSPPRVHQGCSGEMIQLRRISTNYALVLFAYRCALDPSGGCDGVPSVAAGEIVRLPPKTSVWVDVHELRALAAEETEGMKGGAA